MSNNLILIRRLIQEIRPYWLHIAAVFLLGIVGTPLALLTPLPLKIAVDNVLGTDPLPRVLDLWLPEPLKTPTALLLFTTALVIGVALLNQLRELSAALLKEYTGEKMLRGFRAKLFRHVQRLSLSYHDTKGTSDSIYRIQYDATGIQNIVVEGVIPFLSSVLTVGAMIYVTALINWKLALIGLSITPVLLVISRSYRRRLRRQSREVKKLESSALAVVQEVLGSVRVVKAFGQEEREHGRFVEKSNEGMIARLRQKGIEGTYGLLVALCIAVGTAAVLYIGVRDIQSGALTLGSLLLVMGYLAQLYGPMRTIGRKMGSMQSHIVSVERAFALLDESPDVIEIPRPLPLQRAQGAMVFRNVSFSYEKSQPYVLDGISFHVEPGMCLGVEGATGAGKTTLINLLTRFFDPTSGQILLDGVDIREYKLSDLRNQFAIVLQEPVLFSTSIAENIAYARPGANQSEVIAAATAANVHEFIAHLPNGYDTLVGERGMRLSGGERQRISMARAFLKDAPILILDEPTSSVDMKTEATIVEAMKLLSRARTTFLIAHRASVLQHCDVILRIEEGRLVETRPAPHETTFKERQAEMSGDVR